MPDQNTQSASSDGTGVQRAHYDLVVVGAGIAGLNALHAASVHLPSTARVLLIDEKTAPGGMWTMAYDYVRLHQPHPLFTVGNLTWNWLKPKGYLAARDEVQGHLSDCLEAISGKLDLHRCFGHSVQNTREVRRPDGWGAEIDMHPVNAPEQIVTVDADRVIYASGFNYQAPDPLSFSSGQVVSVPPSELGKTLAANPDAPVYVVGGGKTGMDTILEIQAQNTARPITLINGRGTYFFNRTKFFPTGLQRWIGGALAAGVFRDCATRFDGRNEEDVRTYFIANYATNHDPRNRNYLYGVLSEDEDSRIEDALTEKVWDYLEDVVDTPSGPQMQMRSGETRPVDANSIFVNCTGSLFREGLPEDWRPCLSANDVVLSINTRNAMHILTTYSSFMLSHLYLSGTLRDSGLYLLDLEALLCKDKEAFTAASIAQSYHNLLMGLSNLDPKMRRYFGIDFNRWYPLPRRLLALNAIRKTAHKDIAHCRSSLNIVVERFGIKGGLLQ